MQMSIVEPKDKTKRCIQCGCFFRISMSDQIRCVENNWKEPKRCLSCRAVKRRLLESRDPYEGWETIAPGLYKVEFKGGFDVTGHTVRLRY